MSYGKIILLGCLAVGLGACRPSRESITAGQIGCNPDEIQISNENSSMGWSQSSETWTAECNGHTFICSQLNTSTSAVTTDGKGVIGSGESDVACHERIADAAAAPPKAASAASEARASAAPTAPPPTAGAGFELGLDAEGMRKICEGAGQTWAAPNNGHATCSGAAADLGFPADVAIKFCSSKACMVTVRHRPESEWTGMFSELKGKLTAKYGTPNEAETAVPAGCRTEAEFVECLTNQNLRLHFSWTWATGERVILSVGKAGPDTDPAIRIDYTRPVRKVAANASAL